MNDPQDHPELMPLDDVRFAIRVALASETAELRQDGRPTFAGAEVIAELAQAYATLGGDLELAPPAPNLDVVAELAAAEASVRALIERAVAWVNVAPGLPDAFRRGEELRVILEARAAGEPEPDA